MVAVAEGQQRAGVGRSLSNGLIRGRLGQVAVAVEQSGGHGTFHQLSRHFCRQDAPRLGGFDRRHLRYGQFQLNDVN